MTGALAASGVASSMASGATGAVHATAHAVSRIGHTATTAPPLTLGNGGGIDYVREFGAMLVVLGLLFFAARYLKRRSGLPLSTTMLSGGGRALSGRGPITVLSRHALGRGVSIAIVHVGGSDYLVGITPTGVSLLTEVDLGIEGMDADMAEIAGPASVEMGKSETLTPGAGRRLGDLAPRSPLGGASPLQAWMAKLDGLREMTVRRS